MVEQWTENPRVVSSILTIGTIKFKIMLEKTFEIAQIILAILVIVSILMQQQGSGLGGAFAGEGNFYRSKRGLEKVLYFTTIVLIVLFVASVAVPLFLV